jgi:hypothetical protein
MLQPLGRNHCLHTFSCGNFCTGGDEITHESANMASLSQRLIKRDALPIFEPMQLTLEVWPIQTQSTWYSDFLSLQVSSPWVHFEPHPFHVYCFGLEC